jgi:FtsP/CotA-like multicopper oxidase with cupredoxin domain
MSTVPDGAFTMRGALLAIGAAFLVPTAPAPGSLHAAARSAVASGNDSTAQSADIVTHDNRERAGAMTGNTLRVRLEVVRGEWKPEGESGPTRLVYAFAEEGRLPHIPGPLLRVPGGSDIHVSVRNRLSIPVKMHGFVRRPAARDDFVEVPARAVREFRFTAGEPGTYYYWGRTTDSTFIGRTGDDSQLTGALIVDSPTTASGSDRVFVLGEWLGSIPAPGTPRKLSLVINGRSWPHTERLTLPFGQAVEWRVINASVAPHPMHLHGTFYTVESRGTSLRDVVYDSENRRLVTTELMLPGSTMMMRWVPDRVGNWLFHCHILAHVAGRLRAGDAPGGAYDEHAEHDPMRAMAGLVLGIVVQAGDETAAPDLETHVRRRMTLHVRQVPNRYGPNPAYGFSFVNGTEAPPPLAQGETLSPPIVLTKGEPVRIGVSNGVDEALAIHWHGIELESFNDGVPGWSGHSRQIMPPVRPRQTFDVNFTPPRAGTFIYHTHGHDSRQLVSGLYGALIVLEPGAKFDPATDHIVLLGGAGPGVPAVEMNRSTRPPPLLITPGSRHRFRIINIMPNNTLTVTLRGESGLAQWRPVAKDGADLPPNQTGTRSATLSIGVGETYDFEFEPPASGEFRLEASGQFRVEAARRDVVTSMRVRVAP